MFNFFSDADIRGRTEGDSTDCDIKEVRTKQRKKIKAEENQESLATGPSFYSLYKEKRQPIDKNSEEQEEPEDYRVICFNGAQMGTKFIFLQQMTLFLFVGFVFLWKKSCS